MGFWGRTFAPYRMSQFDDVRLPTYYAAVNMLMRDFDINKIVTY